LLLILEEIKKINYSIGEIAKMFNVNHSLIRFWEKEFPQLKPRKSVGGTRKYTEQDVEIFRNIYFLVKEKGFTLQGAKEKLKCSDDTLNQKSEIVKKLTALKDFLINLKRNIK